MKVLKVLVLGLIGLVVALAVIGLALPRQVHIERTTVIAAKPATVYTYLNGWKNFNAWSPWAALDPNTKYTFEGPLVGVGAKQSWFSDDPNVGNGSQEITAVETDKAITIKLMLPNMEPSVVTQTLTPEGEGTKLVWAMNADMGINPLNRWFGLLLEKFIGPDYEKGLASMKPLIEVHAKKNFSGIKLELVKIESMPILYKTMAANSRNIDHKLGEDFAEIGAVILENGAKQVAPPMVIHRGAAKFVFMDDPSAEFENFDPAIIVDRAEFKMPHDSIVKIGRSYGGWVLRTVHVGPNETLMQDYAKLASFKKVAGLENNGDRWEQYLSDVAALPAEQRKQINWPVK